MRITSLAALVLLLSAAAAQAVITKLTPLAEVLESDQYIFVAKADKLDPDNKERPTAVFVVEKKLKGDPPFDRIPVNMTGDDEAKKAGDTKTIFARLDNTRQLVFFVRKQGKLYNAKVFVEGSWFSIYGQLDADGKTIRWALLHGEPFLRRTFKGTSAEMVKTVEDTLAKKASPPEPDEKEKPGYGPPVAAPKKCGEEERGQRTEDTEAKTARENHSPATTDLCPMSSGPLFGVIPSFALAGPLAILAALFPGVFARLAVGMKRWRAFLVVASINSTLAFVYWAILQYRAHWLPASRWVAEQTVVGYFVAVALLGLLWAGQRYRRLAAQQPAVSGTPSRAELYTLAGLTVFVALVPLLTAAFSGWHYVIELPVRDFTFIGVALAVATVYAGYRVVTRRADVAPNGPEPAVRLSVSGECVGLAVLALCGAVTIVQMRTEAAYRAGVQSRPVVAGAVEKGDAEVAFGPRLVGEPVAFEATEDDGGRQVPVNGRVYSNLATDGDRLFFGVEYSNSGRILCMNRHTGKTEWVFDAPGMKSVFCTPRVANGKVYCGEGTHFDHGCRVFCLNAADGSELWQPPFKSENSHTEGTPAVVNGRAYIPAGEDGIFCADAATGARVWQYKGRKEKDVHIDAPPAVSADGKTIYAGSGIYSFDAVALDAETGAERWRAPLGFRSFNAPLVSGDKVFYGIGTGNMGADVFKYDEEDEVRETTPAGAVVCLDAATGKEVWRYALPKAVQMGVAADAFTVYAGCRDGYVYAIDRVTGKLRWKIEIGSGQPVLSAPVVATAGGFPVAVYSVSALGLVVCLNPQTGEVLWQRVLPGFQWNGQITGGVMCTPLVVTTPTPTGSRRTIYVGAMRPDPTKQIVTTVTVFKFEDVIGE